MARLVFRAPASLSRFIAVKGSVALDGVSLTVNEVAGDQFSVLIIPHTLAVTTFGALARGRCRQSRGRPDGALCRTAVRHVKVALACGGVGLVVTARLKFSP